MTGNPGNDKGVGKAGDAPNGRIGTWGGESPGMSDGDKNAAEDTTEAEPDDADVVEVVVEEVDQASLPYGPSTSTEAGACLSDPLLLDPAGRPPGPCSVNRPTGFANPLAQPRRAA